MITLARSSRNSRFCCIRPGVAPAVQSLASSPWTATSQKSDLVPTSWNAHTHTATSTAALARRSSSSDDASTRSTTRNTTWGHTAAAIDGRPSLPWSASRRRALSLSATNKRPLPSTGSSRARYERHSDTRHASLTQHPASEAVRFPRKPLLIVVVVVFVVVVLVVDGDVCVWCWWRCLLLS